MFLREIIGHTGPVQVLKNALLNNRVAHAYLFSGPRGIGKTTTARTFAQAFLCEQGRVLGDSCGECPACGKFMRGNHPDLKIIEPLGASLKIDQIRELVQKVYYKAYGGQGRVYILRDVDTMTTEAANSFLKILEEPPKGVLFLLISSQPYNLLATIVSRCQVLQFFPKDPEYVPSADLAQQRQRLVNLSQRLLQGEILQVFQMAEELEKQKDELVKNLDLLAVWYRDLLVWKTTGEPDLLINADLVQDVQEAGQKFSRGRLVNNLEAIERTKVYLQANVNNRLALENMFLDLLGGK